MQDYRLLAPGQGVLLACSGGADSVALVLLMRSLATEYGWSLAVGHVHHGLRPSAEEDAVFVEALARRLDLAFLTRRLVGLSPPNLEAKARAGRYAALADMARQLGLAAVATAHTLDDQAETVLLRLLRGTGPAGLAGIAPRRPLAPGVDVVRPLLWCRRSQLRQFLAEEGQTWREDESNLDPRQLRNRLRHRLMPLLLAENPRLPEALAQLAEVVREEEAVWAEQVTSTARQLARRADGGWRVALQPFLQLPVGLQRRLLRTLLGTWGGASFVHLEEARGLLRTGQAGQERTLPGGVRVRLESGTFWVGVPPPASVAPVRLAVPGRVVVPELGLMVEAKVEPREGAGPRGAWEAELDVRWAERGLVVRTRQPGDRIRLKVGTRKLQDLLVDLRIPRWDRDRLAVVATEDGEVLWVVGHRVADAARPEAGGVRCVRLRAWPLEADPKAAGRTRRWYTG